jgi:hypothetical protein
MFRHSDLVEFVGRAADAEGLRDLYVGCQSAFTDWPGLSEDETWRGVVEGATEGFALFLAIDGSKLSTADIADFASYTIDRGLFWVSVWGPDCERVHDIFDEVDVGEGLSVDDPVVVVNIALRRVTR